MGTHEDGAGQLWDQNPVCFLCGCVLTVARPLGCVPCEVVSPTTKQLAAETTLLGACLRNAFARSGISFLLNAGK